MKISILRSLWHWNPDHMLIGEKTTLYFNVKWYKLKERIISFKYYRSLRFAIVDLIFLAITFFQNPYRTSRRFLQKKKFKNIYQYGETPLSTMHNIARECNISKKDLFLELGFGRGLSCFWLSQFIQCKIIAVEWIPSFVILAKIISKLFKFEILFKKEDLFETDFSKATVIYLYGSTMEDQEIIRLIGKIKPYKNLKIITVSFPFSDYDNSFTLIKEFEVSFSWGTTSCYLQIVN